MNVTVYAHRAGVDLVTVATVSVRAVPEFRPGLPCLRGWVLPAPLGDWYWCGFALVAGLGVARTARRLVLVWVCSGCGAGCCPHRSAIGTGVGLLWLRGWVLPAPLGDWYWCGFALVAGLGVARTARRLVLVWVCSGCGAGWLVQRSACRVRREFGVLRPANGGLGDCRDGQRAG